MTAPAWQLSRACVAELHRQERQLRLRAAELRREHAYLSALADDLLIRIEAERDAAGADVEADDTQKGHNHD